MNNNFFLFINIILFQPKSRSVTNQQATPWNGTSNVSNTSLQDIQRQQQQAQAMNYFVNFIIQLLLLIHYRMKHDNSNPSLSHLVLHRHQHLYGVVIFNTPMHLNRHHQHFYGIINSLHYLVNLQPQIAINHRMYQPLCRISNL